MDIGEMPEWLKGKLSKSFVWFSKTGGSNPSLSVSKMKKEIDKTHWTIQTLVFLAIIPVFVFLNQIVPSEEIFSFKDATLFFFLPPFFLFPW